MHKMPEVKLSGELFQAMGGLPKSHCWYQKDYNNHYLVLAVHDKDVLDIVEKLKEKGFALKTSYPTKFHGYEEVLKFDTPVLAQYDEVQIGALNFEVEIPDFLHNYFGGIESFAVRYNEVEITASSPERAEEFYILKECIFIKDVAVEENLVLIEFRETLFSVPWQ